MRRRIVIDEYKRNGKLVSKGKAQVGLLCFWKTKASTKECHSTSEVLVVLNRAATRVEDKAPRAERRRAMKAFAKMFG